jgi:hypothetical protein
MEQLPSNIDQLLVDLESPDPAVRQAAATELGKMTVSQERIVLALEKAALADDLTVAGSVQAAAAARAALQTPAHRDLLQQLRQRLFVEGNTPTPTTNSHRFLILAGACLLGIVLGLIILTTSDYFVPWEKLPAPPAGAVELLTFKQGRNYRLVSRSADGAMYTYQVYDGWFQNDASQIDMSAPAFEPCTYAPPQFGPFNNVPRDIISCVTAILYAPDASFQDIFALDKNGDVWRWTIGGGFKEVADDFVIRPCLSGLIGLLVGYLFIVWSRRRRAKRDLIY